MQASVDDFAADALEHRLLQLHRTLPVRQAVGRRQARVREIMHTLPPAAQAAIREDLDRTNLHPGYNPDNDATSPIPVGSPRAAL